MADGKEHRAGAAAATGGSAGADTRTHNAPSSRPPISPASSSSSSSSAASAARQARRGARPRERKTERAVAGGLERGPSRKASMNHLLSFQFEQRGLNADDAAHGRLGISPTGRRRGAGGTRVRLTREQFLQVNGQFFVRETADVSVQAVDPDQPVPWSEVHQVLLQSHEVQQCPICLAPPVAGQITRCGHVYCLPCILHHLETQHKTWGVCPLCDDDVDVRDLRSVIIVSTNRLTVGKPCTMRLMCRRRTSTLAVPAAELPFLPEGVEGFSAPVTSRYFKIHPLSSERVVENILAREAIELLDDESDQLDPFVLRAQAHVVSRWRALQPDVPADAAVRDLASVAHPAASPSGPVAVTAPARPPAAVTAAAASPAKFVPRVGAVAFVPGSPAAAAAAAVATAATTAASATAAPPFPPDTLHVQERVGVRTETAAAGRKAGGGPDKHGQGRDEDDDGSDLFYFYQADDGQPVYLSPLNIRCLMTEYGSLAASPALITAHILDLSTMNVTADVRRRVRFLGHLPMHSTYSFCEMDLKGLLSRATLDKFSQEIHRNRQRRKRREQLERKAELEAQRQQAREERAHYMLTDDLMNFPSPGGAPSAESLRDFLPQPAVAASPAESELSLSPGGGHGAWNKAVASGSSSGPRPTAALSARALRAQWLRAEELAQAAVLNDDCSDEESLAAAYAPRNYKASFLAAAWSSPPRQHTDYSMLSTSPPPQGPDEPAAPRHPAAQGHSEAAAEGDSGSTANGHGRGRKKKGGTKQVLFATNARRLY